MFLLLLLFVASAVISDIRYKTAVVYNAVFVCIIAIVVVTHIRE